MLLKIVKFVEQSRLIFRSGQTSDTFLVSYSIRNMCRDVLQCGILTY